MTWFVIQDEDGPWLTETPAADDIVLFEGEDQEEAERELCRACNGDDWESELDEE